MVKKATIEFKEKGLPQVTFEGEWKRLDIDKAYRLMVNGLSRHIKKIKETRNVRAS